MGYFLEQIAQSLYDEFGNTLNHHCLVFPNRRAGLYFLKYLAARIEKPVWTPSILTINELFRSYSTLQITGNEILLFELYRIYRKLIKSPESFDEFYFWGDMLLNDFDDVDKYLVDASLLFRNVQDIKKIDQLFGGLSENQIEIIKRFWINFNPDKLTSEKSGFISIWTVMTGLYSEFRIALKTQNMAYEGMIFRELAEDTDIDFAKTTRWDLVHFIGFNALNECEKVVMNRFKKAGKGRFYWDYDNSYIKGNRLNSAGFFLRDNLKTFGNDMPSDWSYDTLISSGQSNVQRRVIETSSDVSQVKLITQLIKELPDLTSSNGHHTAIVLADENLLMPVLSSLPENVGDINITMGYPLKQTQVYNLLRHLMYLQRTARIVNGNCLFSYSEVICVLRHAFISGLMSETDKEIISRIVKTNLIWVPSDIFSRSGYLNRIFKKPGTPALLSDYFKDILSLLALNDEGKGNLFENSLLQRNIRNEFIYRIVLSINRLEAITNRPDVSFTADTYIKILDRMLRIQSVPFSGEPLSGIQIMGLLETRALDFRNLIILSVNEGLLPASSTGSSFIPFNLREAFGLPSVNHQESIYAYHFYRLLQRAENVTFTYNSNSDGLRSGEMSRFLIQMKYDTVMKPRFLDVNYEIRTQGSIRDILEKTDDHIKQLKEQFCENSNSRILSPSALNTWLNCRMKFYYRYVNRLKESEKVTADIDAAMFGNILHECMKTLYHDFIGEELTNGHLDLIITNKQLLIRSMNDAINASFNKESDSQISGNELLVREVLMAYLLRVLNTDKLLTPFLILNLEDTFSFKISVISGGDQIEVLTGGKVDRVDTVGGVTRVVDYKTGAVADSINSIEELFIDDRKKDYDGWLQTLLYCEAYLDKNAGHTVLPAVYKIKKLRGNTFSDRLRIRIDKKNEKVIDDYNIVRDDFMMNLKAMISNIFSKDEPFYKTGDVRGKCSYCPYKALCMR